MKHVMEGYNTPYTRWMHIALQECRAATRRLRNQPMYTAIAAGSLAVGVSVAAGTATIVTAVRANDFAFTGTKHAVAFYTLNTRKRRSNGRDWRVSLEALRRLGQAGGRVTAVAASFPTPGVLNTDTWATTVLGQTVTPTYTSILGISPTLGRSFTRGDGDANAPKVIILGHRLWVSRFGSDSSILGHQVRLGGHSYTIIGVTSSDQQLRRWDDFLIPESLPGMIADSQKTAFGIATLARHSTAAGVTTEFTALMPHKAGEHESYVAAPLQDYLMAQLSGALLFMTVIGTLVGIVAGVNFATLVLGRGMRRREELAVRAALGASTTRLVVHLIAECTILGVAGGALGGILAPMVVRTAGQLAQVLLPTWIHIRWGIAAAVVAVGIAVALGLLFGLAPAIELAFPAATGFLHGGVNGDAGARRHRRGRQLLVTVQVALVLWPIVTFASMSGFGLFDGLANSGSNHANRFLGLVGSALSDSGPANNASRSLLLQAVRRVPGVVSAGISESDGSVYCERSDSGASPLEGLGVQEPVDWIQVSPGYFDARGVRLIAGRLPTDEEINQAEPFAVVTADVAARYVDDPVVGWRVKLLRSGSPSATVTIVGIVANLRGYSGFGDPVPQIFTPFFPHGATLVGPGHGSRGVLWVHDMSESRHVASQIIAAVGYSNPNTLIADLQSVRSLTDAESRQILSLVVLGAGLFAVALGLAAVGIYGIIAYSVSSRRKELAVRLALGAQRSHVGLLIVRGAGTQVAIGLATGVVGGLLTAQLVAPANHPLVSPPVSVILIGFAAIVATLLAASVGPVRRVWRTNLATVLREDG